MIEKYLKAKENMKHNKEIQYQSDVLDLYDRIMTALNKKEDYILYQSVLHTVQSDFASKFGFKLERYNWGTYVYFNKRGLKRVEKELEKMGYFK